jgi:hypothetical protein
VPEREALLGHRRDAGAGRREPTARREDRSLLGIGDKNPRHPPHQENPAGDAWRATKMMVASAPLVR